MLTEEDIKLRFITPAIQKGWPVEYITMETQITNGKVRLRGNMASRDKPLRADYLLYIKTDKPIAVVEAKSNRYSISAGLQQAKMYAEKLDLPFAYSSNGEGFEEYDFLTGIERSLNEFPSRDELIERYYQEYKITEAEKKILNQPFYSSQNTFPARFYQRIAINRVLRSIARGQNRLLLVMATGVGKTYVAFQIVNCLLKSGLKNKILYLADRNVLVDQSIEQDFSPLKKTIHKINYSHEQRNQIKSYEVYFSLYQQLIGDNGEKRYEELFEPGFFDFIIVDECHRGSAKADSEWREILKYFSGAAQLGMTATPKENKYVSNINYFGEPIYKYSLNEGIEDGFLAPFKVVEPFLNISDGWRPEKGQKDINGNEIEDRIYNNTDYDYNIILQDRTRAVAEDITNYLKSTDRMQKTIVFCASEDAAERMRKELSNLNSDIMKNHSDYVVRITSSDKYGKSKLDYFTSVAEPFPVIATTSELLSTGVDTKTVKLIVLDKNISSMTQFKQIIGRGTRIVEKAGKLSFIIMDFRGVSRLFADPEWDGPIEIDSEFGKEKRSSVPRAVEKSEPKYKPIVDKNGCEVKITQRLVSVYDTQGKLLKQENIIDYTKRNVRGEFATLENFILKWSEKKSEIMEIFEDIGINLDELKEEQNMQDVDDFDFICHLAYDKKPLTRAERAEKVKRSYFFSKYSGVAREVLEILLEKYMNLGIFEIENNSILKSDPFTKFGTPSRIAGFFNGREGYLEAVRELEEIIYKVG